jgi:hypothetical protein
LDRAANVMWLAAQTGEPRSVRKLRRLAMT